MVKVKKNYFCHFWPFSWLFWRVLKKLSEKKLAHFDPPPKKIMKTAKNDKNIFLPWPTDKIKCPQFFYFLPISLKFWCVFKYVWKIMPLRMAKCVTFLLDMLETSFWCQTTCFLEWEEIIWNHSWRFGFGVKLVNSSRTNFLTFNRSFPHQVFIS